MQERRIIGTGFKIAVVQSVFAKGRKRKLDKQIWAESLAKKIIGKMKAVTERNRGRIPYLTQDGMYVDDMGEKDIYWWTNGFWGGILWQLYYATKDVQYRKEAQKTEDRLEANLHTYCGMDHDSGFKWLLTAVADYRLTGNEKSRDRALIAANSLAGRFNLAGNFIRAWNDENGVNRAGWAIIDCMMNLPLLYWASDELKDPRFSQIARAHADRAMTAFVREDGSVNHIVIFDADTGEIIGRPGGQGYGEGSSWTRGQAWALYGFALSFRHTGKVEYLYTAKRVAHYFIANIPQDGRILVDFRQPAEYEWEDQTAAAVAACGLFEIASRVPEQEKALYQKAALRLLHSLEESACWDEEKDYFLGKCTAAFHDGKYEFPMMYADYFFVEAVWKLCGLETFMW